MKAFIQHLAGIVRVGPDCDRWMAPWEYVAAYSATDMQVAVVHGLKGDGRFTMAHARAIIAAIKALGFQTVTWLRVHEEGRQE